MTCSTKGRTSQARRRAQKIGPSCKRVLGLASSSWWGSLTEPCIGEIAICPAGSPNDET